MKQSELLIEITKRKCHPNVQKDIHVGDRFFITGHDKLKDGTEVVLLAKNQHSKKSAVIRCNANRFEWETLTELDLQIQQAKQEIVDSTKAMMSCMTLHEQMSISFVPLIITQIAWTYANKAKACAARDKVELVKGISRQVKQLEDEYKKQLSPALDFKHIQNTLSETEKCISTISLDLQLLYYSVDNEFKRSFPDYPYHEMRSYAIISQLFIDYLKRYNQEMDVFLADKLKQSNLSPSIVPPIIQQLRKKMEAIAAVNDKFDIKSQNIQIGMKVIENRIKNIEFSIF